MILSWFRQNRRDFGIVRASWLFWRVGWRRARVVASNRLLPARCECPCCGWTGNRFLDYIEMGYTASNTACPRCDSHSRHRALFLWLRDKYGLTEKSGTALILAPERALAPLWSSATLLRSYKIDVEANRGVDVLADAMYLPFAANVANLIWCHHVLEQVEDDLAALKEFHRVLIAESGELVISAGVNKQGTTREFGFSNKQLSGNRRAYGADFASRLANAGFDVTTVSHDLSEAEYRKYGIVSERFYRCRKPSGPSD
jgi:SAM-dependent methyltransferase